MNMQDSKFNGLPFNRMERRAVIIVRPLGSLQFARVMAMTAHATAVHIPRVQHWQSFSPLNAQVRLTENLPWHSFFLVSRYLSIRILELGRVS
jgi:hypothetical protein